MKKTTILLLLLVFTISTYGQDILKGYYITNGGVRTEGYFLEGDFANAESLKFKAALTADPEKIDPATIKEYGLEGNLKFQKFTVNIDASGNNTANLSKDKNAEWISKTVFLSVLVEGNATLYSYFDNGTKFFYKVNSKNIPVTQLVYKRYMSNELSVAENNHYRQQLFNDVKCEGEADSAFLKIPYDEKGLIKIFEAYNTCSGGASQTRINPKSNKLKVEFTVFAGLYTSKLILENEDPMPTNNKITNTGVNFGGEVALVMPSRKLAFFLRGDYEKVSETFINEEQTSIRYTKYTSTVNGTYINFYVGLRYNLFINSNNKFFIDGAVASSIPSGTYVHNYYSVTDFTTTDKKLKTFDLSNNVFLNFGVGYVFNNRFGIDVRANTSRNLLDQIDGKLAIKSSGRLSLSLRYTIY